MKKKVITELVRNVHDNVIGKDIPETHMSNFKDTGQITSQFEKDPKCFITFGQGQRNLVFPICSASSIVHPKMIEVSLNLARKYYEKGYIKDENEYETVVMKLKSLQRKYSADAPKTSYMAHIKRMSTMDLNKQLSASRENINDD